MNLMIHEVPETDAVQDKDAMSEILSRGLHMEFDRHDASGMIIGKADENRPRPIRLESMHGKKKILSKAKDR